MKSITVHKVTLPTYFLSVIFFMKNINHFFLRPIFTISKTFININQFFFKCLTSGNTIKQLLHPAYADIVVSNTFGADLLTYLFIFDVNPFYKFSGDVEILDEAD